MSACLGKRTQAASPPRWCACTAPVGGGTLSRGCEVPSWPLPFMVLAVEQPIEDLAQRADVVQVVQDDDQGHVHSVVLTVALIGKVGQVRCHSAADGLAYWLEDNGNGTLVMMRQ